MQIRQMMYPLLWFLESLLQRIWPFLIHIQNPQGSSLKNLINQVSAHLTRFFTLIKNLNAISVKANREILLLTNFAPLFLIKTARKSSDSDHDYEPVEDMLNALDHIMFY